MSITRIKSYGISDGAITTNKISGDVSLGVKISSVEIANSSYTVLDDTAVALEGGYLVITGSGFASGCQVIVGANTATSTTFVNSTTIRAQVGAADAGTKTLYVVNTDGGTAIRVNGLTYSATPTWVTGSTLTEGAVDEAISIQLSASGATSYQVQTGSTLPTGLSLSANGLLSGAATGIEADTTYSFTIEAIDDENQESPRSFSITITFGDEYFNYTTLLLTGDGANGANNNTFLDSSNNNFAITRSGNTSQGTFSPFSAPDGRWSNYFDGTGDYLNIPDSTTLRFGSGSFTIEAWIYLTQYSPTYNGAGAGFSAQIFNKDAQNAREYDFSITGNSSSWTNIKATLFSDNITPVSTTANFSFLLNTWYHIAIVRNGTSVRFYVDGVDIGGGTNSTTTQATNSDVQIGSQSPFWTGQGYGYFFPGYISNLRVVKGTAVYTDAFTPQSSPLTAIANTSLLTCQSNRFVDNSTNAFAITRNGDVRVTPFSPFAPSAAYSASTNGGSGYFDGTGDYLTAPDNAAWDFGTGDFTIETWIYPTTSGTIRVIGAAFSNSGNDGWSFELTSSNTLTLYAEGSYVVTSTGTVVANAWNHVVVSRSGTSLKLFINGVLDGSVTNSSNISGSTATITISATPSGTALFTGYQSNFRVVTGTAVYTAAFTPPTAPLTAITNTSLLCNFTNAGIFDNTGKNNLETVGNAQIDTSVKKYGTGSMAFDGTGDWLLMPSTQDLSFGTGNFTVEMWIYPTSVDSTTRALVSNRTDAGADSVFACAFNTTNGLYLHTQNTAVLNSGDPPTINVWQHVAFVRNNGTLKIYLNGTEVGSASSAQNLSGTQQVYIGKDGIKTTSPASPYIGYIDDLRITKGIARYTSNFTPPTSAHRLK